MNEKSLHVYVFNVAILIYFVLLSLYLGTLCPTIYPYDTTEFITASWALGIAHSPGAPFCILVMKFFQLLVPFGNIAFRANIVSALTSALAPALIFLVIEKLSRICSTNLFPRIIGGICGSLILAGFQLYWGKAVMAEVYGFLSIFLILLIWIYSLKTSNKNQLLLYAIFFIGLSTHVSLLFSGGILVIVYFARTRRNPVVGKTIPIIFLLLVIGGSIYLFLPVRSSVNCLVNWGTPSKLGSFWGHVTGSQYSNIILARHSLEYYEYYLSLYMNQVWENLSLFTAVLIVMGLVYTITRVQGMAVISIIILVTDFLFIMLVNPTGLLFDQCLTATLIIFAILGGIGACVVVTSLGSTRVQVQCLLFLLFMSLSFWNMTNDYIRKDYRSSWGTLDYGHHLVEFAEPGSYVFLDTETQVFTISYLYHVEKFRDDLFLEDRLGIFFPGYCDGKEFDEITRRPVVRLLAGHVPFRSPYKYYPLGMAYHLLREKPSTETIITAWNQVHIRGLWRPATYRDWCETGLLVWQTFFHGEYLRMTGNSLEKVFQEYEKASITADNVKDLHHNLGGIFNRLGNLTLAFKEFKLETESYPFSVESMVNVGLIYRYLKNPDAAITWFKKAYKITPESPVIQMNLGLAMYESPNHKKQGIILLENFINRFPKDPNIEQIRNMLNNN